MPHIVDSGDRVTVRVYGVSHKRNRWVSSAFDVSWRRLYDIPMHLSDVAIAIRVVDEKFVDDGQGLFSRMKNWKLPPSNSEFCIFLELGNDQSKRTDSSYVIVGRTKNFIFFYDKEQERGDNYSNVDVKELRFFKHIEKR